MKDLITWLFIGGLNLILVATIMPFYIQFLKQHQFGQEIREEGPSWHQKKSGTPTMGGLIFIVTSLFFLLVMWAMSFSMTSEWVPLLITLLGFGAIGFVDDAIKVFRHHNEGFTSKQKFFCQVGLAILVWASLYFSVNDWQLHLAFFKLSSPLLTLLFTVFWLVGFSNAVNLTDGLDGLAGTTTAISFLAYFYLAYQEGFSSIEAFSALLIGGLLGFLIYNKKPARIFMGDTGSLALGGLLAVMSLMLGRPLLLLSLGIIYVIETASVILQVISFKTTGKRIFKMSPIHHHFEMCGWKETSIVAVFALITAVFSLLAIHLY